MEHLCKEYVVAEFGSVSKAEYKQGVMAWIERNFSLDWLRREKRDLNPENPIATLSPATEGNTGITESAGSLATPASVQEIQGADGYMAKA